MHDTGGKEEEFRLQSQEGQELSVIAGPRTPGFNEERVLSVCTGPEDQSKTKMWKIKIKIMLKTKY
jgi:hypothetical protein